jgi:plasmid stabilization system protein ParE
MTRLDKSETGKVTAYRKALQKIAKAPDGRHPALEGKAAKLGIEIQNEESKAAPRPNPKPQPRRRDMPRGDKDKYTDKQKRQAEHIEEGYEDRGVSKKEAESRAWATVNKTTGGGKKPGGSGVGKKENMAPARKGGRKGGAAAAARPKAARNASAKKAAATRKRNAS